MDTEPQVLTAEDRRSMDEMLVCGYCRQFVPDAPSSIVKLCVDWHHWELTIYDAVYGTRVVTETVRELVDHSTQSLSVLASNKIFGDPWHNTIKSLVVVWGIGGDEVETTVAREHSGRPLKIKASEFKSNFVPPNEKGQINVLSAVYGGTQMRDKIQSKLKLLTSSNTLIIPGRNTRPSNALHWKALVLVYRLGLKNEKDPTERVFTKVTKNGEDVDFEMDRRMLKLLV